jgi:hypothetical protein
MSKYILVLGRFVGYLADFELKIQKIFVRVILKKKLVIYLIITGARYERATDPMVQKNIDWQ